MGNSRIRHTAFRQLFNCGVMDFRSSRLCPATCDCNAKQGEVRANRQVRLGQARRKGGAEPRGASCGNSLRACLHACFICVLVHDVNSCPT
eukprot:14395918-Alexandrium_andersonii.AAC.1